jgi:D-alanine transaminase
MTPPNGHFILPGITRELVLEVMQAAQLPCRETEISLAQLRAADEIWLTSSTNEILPVTLLDGIAVGKGCPGELWSKTWQLYQEYKRTNFTTLG